MRGLSSSEIQGLLAGKSKQATQHNCLVRVDGKLQRANVSSKHFGAYEGKAGSLRRSRNGNITRALNGSRRYVASTDHEVVMY